MQKKMSETEKFCQFEIQNFKTFQASEVKFQSYQLSHILEHLKKFFTVLEAKRAKQAYIEPTGLNHTDGGKRVQQCQMS